MSDASFEQGRPLQTGYNYEWTFVSSPTPTLYLRRKPEHQRKSRGGSNIRPHAILPYAIPPARKTAGRIVPSGVSPQVAKRATPVVDEGPCGAPRLGSATSQPLNSIVGPGLSSPEEENVPCQNGVQPSPLDSLQGVHPPLPTAAVHSLQTSQRLRTDARQSSSIDEDNESLFGDSRSPPSNPQHPSGDVESSHRDVHRSLVSTPQQPSDADAARMLPVTAELGDPSGFQLADIHPAADASLFSFDSELLSDLFSPSFLATPHDDLYLNPTSNALLTSDSQSFLDSWLGLHPYPQPEAHHPIDLSYVPPDEPYVWGLQDPISSLHYPQDAVSAGLFQSALPSQSSMQAPLYPAMISLPTIDAGFGAQSADYHVQDFTHWPLEQ